MAAIGNQNYKSTNKKSLFELFTEIVSWLQIFASPFLMGLITGSIIYFFNPGTTRLIIAVFIAIIGLFTALFGHIESGEKKEQYILCQGVWQPLNLIKLKTQIIVMTYRTIFPE